MGVARTRDSGHTWSLVWKEDKTAAPNIHDAWISKQINVEWAENPLEISVADQDPNLCFGTDFGRTMKPSLTPVDPSTENPLTSPLLPFRDRRLLIVGALR